MSELSRFSLTPIVVKHFEALRPSGRASMTGVTALVLFAVPAAIAIVSLITQFMLDRVGGTALLTATGLLVGAMVTAFIFLANLRIKISESEQLKAKRTMARLTSETAAGCLYCAALALTVSVAIAAGLAIPQSARPDWLHVLGTAFLVFGLAHLGVNFLTVLRRLFGIYYEVFKSDFVQIADAGIASEANNRAS